MANPSKNNPKEGTAATPNSTSDPASFQSVIPRVVEEEMKSSYLDYAMSVIVGRALPDVRDGLKPVHRRILYAMHEMGMVHNKPFKKSARIVGEVLGKYHPHGDTAVYDALVRLAQEFSMRYPLINGQGNFGSVDGDNAAAMRYCVTGDSLVVTEKGLVPIDNLSNSTHSSDVQLNLKVLSKDKRVHTASKWFDSGSHPTKTITTFRGYSLTGTSNHPILVLTKDEAGKPIFLWKLMGQLQEGDIAVIDRSTDHFWPKGYASLHQYFPTLCGTRKNRILPQHLDEDVAFLLGSFISEGSLHDNKIEFCNTDSEWIDLLQEIWNRIFPDSKLHRFDREPNSFGKQPYSRVECHCRHTIHFLRNIGLCPVKSGQRRIPKLILQSPKPVAAMFLKSYFEGDGTVTFSGKMRELGCCSMSKGLLKDIQTLLLRFGIDSFLRRDNYRNIWKLYIRGKRNALRFYREIGFLFDRKTIKLEYLLHHYKKDTSLTDYVPFIADYLRSLSSHGDVAKYNFDRYSSMKKNYQQVSSCILNRAGVDVLPYFQYLLTYHYLFDPIVKIEDSGDQRVFSIKVESNCHSFISNGFISHNTESRLTKIAEELLVDIEKDTVEFTPNFDASLKEPAVLPSKIPNLLINGSSGIAVGMATNIPPHNAGEIIDGAVSLIDNPECSADDLFIHVKGPDFPTAAIISGTNEIRRAYLTGQGKVQVKAKADIEPHKDRERIIVTEIPYQANKAALLEEIAELVRDKKITGIADLRDESDRDGMRIVIELKKDANSTVVLNQLYTYTRMTQTFGMNMLALVDNEPKLLSLKQLLQHFITHRQVVVRKRTEFDLKKAEEKSHLLEGLIIALNNIDAIIQKIKKSATVETAKAMLMKDYDLSELQAKAILDMRLQKLSSLEQEKIREEQKQLLLLIKELKEILASEQRILGIIKQELLELKQQYGDARKTIIEHTDGEEELVIEDLIKEEPMVVTISRSGYIKRLPLTTYRQQGRGGTGVKGAGTKEDDIIERLFVASTHSYILFFTNKGRVYWQKVYQIPEAGRQAKGRAIVNFIQLSPGELVQAVVPVKEFNSSHYLFLATRKGTVKKTELEAYSRPRQGGIIAVTLDEGDELVNACITTGNDQIILATKHGMAVRFHEENVRPMGRGATGVRGITLKGDDVVIAMVIADDKQDLLTVTEHGYGKRTLVSEYRLINRGGSGVINIQCTERNGNVVSVCSVTEEDDIMLISRDGILIRMACKGVSQIGRNTQGVRLMRLREEDTVIATTRVISEQQDIV